MKIAEEKKLHRNVCVKETVGTTDHIDEYGLPTEQ
jgi:hypothetical protein